MYRILRNPSYWRPISAVQPDDGGALQPVGFEARYRALDDDAHARRRSNAQHEPQEHEQRAPFERSERSPDMGWPSGPLSPYARAPESDAFPPAWAIVLAIAIALAALACFGKWK